MKDLVGLFISYWQDIFYLISKVLLVNRRYYKLTLLIKLILLIILIKKYLSITPWFFWYIKCYISLTIQNCQQVFLWKIICVELSIILGKQFHFLWCLIFTPPEHYEKMGDQAKRATVRKEHLSSPKTLKKTWIIS